MATGRWFAVGWLAFAGGCASVPNVTDLDFGRRALVDLPLAPSEEGPRNVLLFVADDLGVDRLKSYGVGEELPSTPVLDGLAADGVQFERAWAQPLCSPGRAAILTGRQPYATLVGHALAANAHHPLELDETTLPELIRDAAPVPTTTAMIGKWHLSSTRLGEGYPTNPNDQGFDHFAGLMVGLDDEITSDGLPQDYFDWERTEDGVNARKEVYVTTVNANDAIEAIETLPEPWVIEVAWMAPHAPLHWPPDRLWSGNEVGSTDQRQKTNAMIEAMDTEMGRVIAALGAKAGRTTVMFTADNGTEPAAVSAPFSEDRAKGTAFEGGLRVPLIVAGAGVEARGAVSDALVQTTDVFATVAELTGVPASAVDALDVDSVSLVPAFTDPDAALGRTTAFAEEFSPSGPGPYTEHTFAVRNERFKLLYAWTEGADPTVSMFDLRDGVAEGTDLLADGALIGVGRAAYDQLVAAIPAEVQW